MNANNDLIVPNLDPSFVELGAKTKEEYPWIPDWRLQRELTRLAAVFEETRNMVGKKVLDLGCGSFENYDRGPWAIIKQWLSKFELLQKYGFTSATRFEPWYCRVAHLGGADVTGIDIADNSKEPFQGLQMNLLDIDNTLGKLSAETYDAVNNLCFTAQDESRVSAYGTSPTIVRAYNYDFDAVSAFDKKVSIQVLRILKEGGAYTQTELMYRKKKRKLRQVQGILE